MKRLYFLFGLLISAFTLFAREKDPTVAQFLNYLSQKKWDASVAMMGPQMKAKVTPDIIQQIWTGVESQLGSFKSYNSSTSKSSGTYKIVEADVSFEKMNVICRVTLDGDKKVEGLFFEPPKQNVTATVAMAAGETADSVSSGGGTLYGTLLQPAGNPICPVVLILPGSGPTDRNGDNPLLPASEKHTYQMLAKALADKGIASLRFDKRGVGQSRNFPISVSFTDYEKDAAAWVAHLKTNKRFSDVVVLGHSEGGIIATLLSDDQPVNKLVLLATPAESLDKILNDQLKKYLPDSTLNVISSMMQQLAAGKKPDVPAELSTIFNESTFALFKSAYGLAPCEKLAKTKSKSVLIVNGTADGQVVPEQAEMLHKCLPSSQLVLINDMTHLLRIRQAHEQGAQLPLSTQLIDNLAVFVKK